MTQISIGLPSDNAIIPNCCTGDDKEGDSEGASDDGGEEEEEEEKPKVTRDDVSLTVS